MRSISYIIVFVMMAAFLSCFIGCREISRGDDVGDADDTVSVSFKESEAPENISVNDIADMLPIFTSIVNVIEYSDDAYRSGDDEFIIKVLSELAAENNILSPDKALLDKYAFACFENLKEAPNAEYGSMYDVPDTGLTVKVSDFLADEDGTFTAYIDCIDQQGEIINLYIFTLVKTDNAIYPYSVRSAIIMR